jgi:FkbM family methyltransferase
MNGRLGYLAQRWRYGLCRRLGLLTAHEYDRKKTLLGHLFQAEPKGYTSSSRGSGFRRNFAAYIDDNGDAIGGKYLRLLAGLDGESRDTVCLALSRMMKLYHAKGRGRMRFGLTPREGLAQRAALDELAAKAVRLPGGVWAYGGWLLPHWELNMEVLHHRHFIEDLSPAALRSVRGRDVLDVGGYIGDSALVLAGYTDKMVYSFEPSPLNLEKIRETIRLNGAARIVPVPLGLGDREETLFMAADHVFGSGTFSARGEPVKVTTLDEWAGRSGADVGLIKVDIEGHEQRFLKGAVETIKKHRPAMLLSVYHNASDFFEIKPFIEGLGLGYGFKVRKPVGHFVAETTLVCEAGGQ